MLEISDFVIVTFYKFTKLPHYQTLKGSLLNICYKHNIKGTILIAEEGINATITGSRQAIEFFQNTIEKLQGLSGIDTYKYSYCEFQPFKRMKVRLKKQIVTFNSNCFFDPTIDVGTYLNSDQWDELLKENDVVIIDTRNHYEVVFGTFKNALNPQTNNFSELVEWTSNHPELKDKSKKVAMFCTGGIRCEKSSSYMKKIGYENVYHLKGGILQYIEDRIGQNSLWEGYCFVFDDRIALDKNLKALNTEVNY